MLLHEWTEILSKEYLSSFIPEGGSGVKIVVPAGSDTPVIEPLLQAAREAGLVVAVVDASKTRVDRLDQVFTAVAQQLDWRQMAAHVRERAVLESNYQVPAELPWTFETIAQANGGIASHFVRSAMERWFSEHVFRDFKMTQDFRMAMSFLCFEPMTTSVPGDSPIVEGIIEWLRGELHLIAAVRPAQIFQRVARHNARDLFLSLSHWVQVAGHNGLMVVIDIRATATRSRALAEGTNFYTKAALYDLYEVIRQFIDSTDEMEATLLTFVAPPESLEDELRGLYIYRALTMRIADEVHDRRRDNPMASLVRVHTGAR